MKKISIVFSTSILLIVCLGFFGWIYKSTLLELVISKQLSNVPVRIDKLDVSQNIVILEDFFIGNIAQSKTSVSFGSKNIAIDMPLKKVMEDPFVINSVALKDILIAVEYFNESGTENNWKIILNESNSKWKIKKNCQIKKIVLENITIQVTNHNGKITKYPTINKMEFYNVDHLEKSPIDKAILNTILTAVFSRLGLDNLLDNSNLDQVTVPHISSNMKKNSGN